jgi:hypothetical protein
VSNGKQVNMIAGRAVKRGRLWISADTGGDKFKSVLAKAPDYQTLLESVE